MNDPQSMTTAPPPLTRRQRTAWRIAQVLLWLAGAGILLALVIRPGLGIHAFWNVLIPVAPALLMFLPGLWRNICPLGSTSLLARHLGRSRRIKLPVIWQRVLTLVGVFTLLLIVPLRHVFLDLDGPATAACIALLALAAIGMGLLFEWKSGWCSGLCPVHPVEKLYGSNPIISVPNAHCHSCQRCVSPCPDSTPGMNPLKINHQPAAHLGGTLMVGGFAGYIWGWFQVPDYAAGEGWAHLDSAFALPFAGMAVTCWLFLLLKRILPDRAEPWLVRSFAAAAIACYYWFRLPALFGFGPFPGDGMLIDLRGTLPPWFPLVSRLLTTALVIFWMVGRADGRRSWGVRPAYG